MKIEVWCDSGANIKSCRKGIIDLEIVGIDNNEWKQMSEDDRLEIVNEWANEKLYIGYKELK